jgi:multidrug efflux pump subunit AcrB
MLILLLAVIAFTFRSFVQTLIILMIVPLSLIGIGWGHFIHGAAVDMPSYLGIVILLGVIVNDSIVFINHMNNKLRKGLSFNAALLDAGKSRFRPIVLTSLTTIAGLAPLIISNNPTAGMVIPMAISVAYGLLVATLCTLFVLPTLLASSNALKRKWKKLITGVEPTSEEVEQAVKELEAEKMM